MGEFIKAILDKYRPTHFNYHQLSLCSTNCINFPFTFLGGTVTPRVNVDISPRGHKRHFIRGFKFSQPFSHLICCWTKSFHFYYMFIRNQKWVFTSEEFNKLWVNYTHSDDRLRERSQTVFSRWGESLRDGVRGWCPLGNWERQDSRFEPLGNWALCFWFRC